MNCKSHRFIYHLKKTLANLNDTMLSYSLIYSYWKALVDTDIFASLISDLLPAVVSISMSSHKRIFEEILDGNKVIHMYYQHCAELNWSTTGTALTRFGLHKQWQLHPISCWAYSNCTAPSVGETTLFPKRQNMKKCTP